MYFVTFLRRIWYYSIYLSSNNVKPLLGTLTYARHAAGILVKLKLKMWGCNQYTTIKNKISKSTG